MSRLAAIALCLTTLTGCAHVLPILGQVLSRIDIPTVIRCAQLPSPTARAHCLGLQVASPALDVSLMHAAELAERARDAAGPAGASDYTEADRRRLARDLDRAMGRLELQIAEAHGTGVD